MPSKVPNEVPSKMPTKGANMRSVYSIAKALKAFNIDIAEIAARKLVNDSRLVDSNTIFCGVMGSQQDGREYIDAAVDAGAVAVIAQCLCESQHGNILIKTRTKNGVNEQVKVIQFFELDKHLYQLASNFYNNPAEQLTLVGITGTNGKTSTSQMLADCLDQLGENAAVIGTVGAGKLPRLKAITNTTPGPTELNDLLAGFVRDGITHVAMEVSSHALDQHRVSPEMFDLAVFTNLSRDHLDYHKTMEAYARAKFSLFSGGKQKAVINFDDKFAKNWLATAEQAQAALCFTSKPAGQTNLDSKLSSDNQLSAENIQHDLNGLAMTLSYQGQQQEIRSKLFGDFNVENILAVASSLLALGYSLSAIAPVFTLLNAPAGRMESFTHNDLPICVVDYAHTPDALENALLACRQHCSGELWLVFGCGGDRDKGKRPLMGAAAEKYADHIVITNDNPRSEAPEFIANDILHGIEQSVKAIVMLEREQAVRWCLQHAKSNDLVLLAGKGHEQNIIIKNRVFPYDERALVQSIYAKEASA